MNVGKYPGHLRSTTENKITHKVNTQAVRINTQTIALIKEATSQIQHQFTSNDFNSNPVCPENIYTRLCYTVNQALMKAGNPTTSDYPWEAWSKELQDENLKTITSFLYQQCTLSKQQFPELLSILQIHFPDLSQKLQPYSNMQALSYSGLLKLDIMANCVRALISLGAFTKGAIDALYHFPCFKNLFPYDPIYSEKWINSLYSLKSNGYGRIFLKKASEKTYNDIITLLKKNISEECYYLMYETHKSAGLTPSQYVDKPLSDVAIRYSYAGVSLQPLLISAYDKGLVSASVMQTIYKIGISEKA